MVPTWMIVCGIAATTAVVAELANRRRNKRKDINKVGFMPWTTITAMSLLTVGGAVAIGMGFISAG